MLSEILKLFDAIASRINGTCYISIESRGYGIRMTVTWASGMQFFQQYDRLDLEGLKTEEGLINDFINKANGELEFVEKQYKSVASLTREPKEIEPK